MGGVGAEREREINLFLFVGLLRCFGVFSVRKSGDIKAREEEAGVMLTHPLLLSCSPEPVTNFAFHILQTRGSKQ